MKLLVLFVSLWFFIPQQTDIYTIVKLSGNVKNTSTGKSLNQGDQIQAIDEIQFGDKNAYALVVADKGERYKMNFTGSGPNTSGLYKGLVKNSLSKSKRMHKKTRSFITNADVKDLKEFLGEDEFTVIGDALNVQLSKQVFQDKSILAKYDKDGQVVDKSLVDQDYKLNLSRKNMGAKAVGEVKLYHVDFFQKADAQGIQKITRLDFHFIDEKALKDEMATIIGVYKKKGYDKIAMKDYLMEYFVDFYGNTHMYTLSEFVDKIVTANMN